MNTRNIRLATLLVMAIALSLATAPDTRAQVGKNTGVLNPNTATAAALAGLPGVNPDLAGRIVAGRPYPDMDALDKTLASGLSAEQRKALYARLFLPINLNTASVASIRMVPGVGRRMTWEFQEYRPYRGIAEFRREIGKYVDDAEVARLEQYVFVPMDANKAGDAALMTIPGLTDALLKALKQARPFADIDDFRAKIGKHASEPEASRLARYVTVN
ncbi:MAG: helix-hairpin-helix domain-containing protein [Deltaproteobacteria bacterium]|nr:helix-hairpin-helix domain-containing protein [Deltaproteobacteria bacterium]